MNLTRAIRERQRLTKRIALLEEEIRILEEKQADPELIGVLENVLEKLKEGVK